MEKIELRVEQRSGERLDTPWSAVFGLAGGTVGRGGQNKLILPDPEEEVARVHAMVRLGTNEAYIANLCERRLMAVDGTEVRPGQEVPLPVGSQVHIGPYLIVVGLFGANGTATPPPVVRAAVAPVQPPAPAAEPIEVVLPETPVEAAAPPMVSDLNPFADFVETASPAQPVERVSAPPPLVPAATWNDTPLAPRIPSSTLASAPPPGRPLVIPDDFNPFEVVNRPPPKDEWGGLQAQSLTELAQQSHDGLIKALPLTGRMDDTLDNPAHSGLPKQLDPNVELDPLALFEQSSFLDAPDLAEASTGRTSELAHVFHLPKTENAGQVGQPSATDAFFDQKPPTQASAASLLAVQSVGLQTVQGLDLGLFGESGMGSNPSSLLSAPLPSAPMPAIPAAFMPEQAPEAPAPVMGAPASAALQAFGLSLSGEAPTPIGLTAAPLQPQQPPHPPQAAPAAAPTPTNATLPPANDTSALAAAFLEGAGLTPDRVNLTVTPAFMRTFGEAFRLAIEGSIDLLAARSEIKQEFRAGVTIISSSANNPLKFLPNADGVIMQMIGQQFPGFMKPVPAIQEAYSDLRVHQLALMAGIRAAYTEALTRFDPVKLEEQSPKGGVLASLYGGARKAALWDDYKKNFGQLKNSAEDDLTAFSGQTFVQAYEKAASAAKGEP